MGSTHTRSTRTGRKTCQKTCHNAFRVSGDGSVFQSKVVNVKRPEESQEVSLSLMVPGAFKAPDDWIRIHLYFNNQGQKMAINEGGRGSGYEEWDCSKVIITACNSACSAFKTPTPCRMGLGSTCRVLT